MRKPLLGLGLVILVLCLFLGIGQVVAEPITGAEILQQVDQVLTGAESQELEIKLTIVNEQGQEREQVLQLLSKGAKFGLVKFLAPMDVEGTGFLMRQEKGELQIWLYLPALGNARKITSQMQQGNFMGTDFSYSDLMMLDGSKYQDRYSSELVGKVNLGEEVCYLLTLTPADQELGYSKIQMWVRETDFVPIKLEFYDLEAKRVKVMTNERVQEVGGYLTPHQIVMENVQAGTKTILEIQRVLYNVDLPDQIFTPRYLERS